MPKNREIAGRFLGERFVFDNGPGRRTVIGDIETDDDTLTVRGYADEDALSDGMFYRFYGHFKNHPKYGQQFAFNSFSEESPCDEESIVAYLKQCKGPHRGSITDRVAWALIGAFGATAIDVVLTRPAEASAAVSRWPAEKALLASQFLRERENSRKVRIELIQMLDGRNLPRQTVDRAVRKWGTAAAEILRKDPYELMALRGCGFLIADKLYCDLARQTSATEQEYQDRLAMLRRQSMCAAYAVKTDQNGSVWLPIQVAENAVRKQVNTELARPSAAVALAVSQGILALETYDRREWVATAANATNERDIVAVANDMLMSLSHWPDSRLVRDFCPPDKPMTEHQWLAIHQATQARLGILKGSPGVGKTYCVAALVKSLISQYGEDSIAIACPTGKAAVRATEAMHENGVALMAKTIHRLLVVQTGDDGEWSFQYNATNPLPFRWIIVDETSMVDCSLMASLLRAVSTECHVLLVGDAEQLSPVGVGRPFLDLQEFIPAGALTEIRRNSGRIVRSCAVIRDERRLEVSPDLDEGAGENLPMVDCDPDDQPEVIQSIIDRLAGSGVDPVWDVQVIVACNQGTRTSRREMNDLLQSHLNPRGERVAGNPFRLQDKVICLKNSFFPASSRHESEGDAQDLYVANGEIGRVSGIQPGRMEIELSSPDRIIIVPHAPVAENESDIQDTDSDTQKGRVGDWDLAYAISCHKSQGSQFPFVIVSIDADGKARRVQSRNWLFTAISRAQRVTFLVGDRQVANDCCRRDGLSGRKTLLVELARRERVGKVPLDELMGTV